MKGNRILRIVKLLPSKPIANTFCYVLVVCILFGMADFAFAAFDDNLVGYYTFDGNYSDTSGSTHTNNASAVGSPNINASGLFGQGVYVSGGVNYVTLGQPLDYLFGSSTSFTFTYWIKVPAAVASDPTIIGNKDWSASGGRKGFVQALGSGDDIKANIADGSTRKDTEWIDLDPGQWVFCALVVDRGSSMMTSYVLDENVINQWDDSSTPMSTNIGGVGSVDSGYPINLGQDGDGSGYTQVNATFDDMGVWRRPLAEYEIWGIYKAGRQGKTLSWVIDNPPEIPAEKFKSDVGPYVQFTGPHTAVVRWDTPTPANSIVQYRAMETTQSLQATDESLTTAHEVVLDDIHIKGKYFYRIGCSTQDGDHFTETFWFDNNLNYSRVDVSDVKSPWPNDDLTQIYEEAAEQIVAQSKITKGICLIYGCGQGRLAFELAKRTDMMIIGVDTDGAKIDAAAAKLIEAGVYGARVTVRKVASLDSLPFTKYMANLIVSDNLISSGQCQGSAVEMLRVLRPSGGVALLGKPSECSNLLSKDSLAQWLSELPVPFTVTENQDGPWAKVVAPQVPGAGWWSHANGGPDNAGNSNDNLQGGTRTSDFDLQWVSWPGADAKVDRQVRGQCPVTFNGRMVYRGFNRIITLDTYNGSILWSLEIPELKRFNVPRDSGWICIDDDSVYIAVDDDCWTLDANTGSRTLTHKLDEPGYDWGCVFRYGDKLFGSTVIDNSFYTGWWGSTYWYDSGWNQKICSKSIFANNLDGTRAWTYDSADSDKGIIINSAICLGGGRLYFVESRSPAVKASTSGRLGEELWNNLYLVALNPDTGEKLWEKNLKSGSGGDPVVVNGTVTFFLMYSDEKVVISLADSGTKYHLYAYDVTDTDCSHSWYQNFTMKQAGHGGNKKRAVITAGNVYLEQRAYRLSNGSLVTAGIPWANCGTYSGNANTIFYRGGNIALWDIDANVSTSWSRIRPNCWISVIGSGGMVLAPEGGGGCDCYNGGFHTSAAFVRSDEQ